MPVTKSSHRRAMMLSMAVFSAIFLTAPHLEAEDALPVLKRKNIDNLTQQELAAYEHAWDILTARSKTNEFDLSGRVWQAWVHNQDTVDLPNGDKAFPGRCEHGSDVFLVWHRAELYFFEQVLQATDPKGETGPSTKNVTIPYWNWTRPPSGKRYPKVFEDEESVLYHENRNREPIDKEGASFASPRLIGYHVHFLDWLNFGGGKKAVGGGFGLFEIQAHNPMHSLYIGGSMGAEETAAEDPIFFSFHCYIDMIFQEWINQHDKGQMTSSEIFMRGTQPKDVRRPPGYKDPQLGADRVMGHAGLYFEMQPLGYDYEILDADRFMTKDELNNILAVLEQRSVFGDSPESRLTLLLKGGQYGPSASPTLVRNQKLRVPATTSRLVGAVLKADPQRQPVSYQVDVYLHPQNCKAELSSRKFRSRYLASSFVRWEGRHHSHGMAPRDDFVRLTSEVNSLVPNHAGENWTITFAVSPIPITSGFKDVDVRVR